MKKPLILMGGLLVAIYAYGQTNTTMEVGCDCAACLAKAAGETLPYTLDALQELNEHQAATNTPAPQVEALPDCTDCDGDHDHAADAAHEGHDHEHAEHDHDEDVDHDHAEDADHDEHNGHDHGPEVECDGDHEHEAAADPHAGHDHGPEAECDGGHDHEEIEGVALSPEMAEKLGVQVHEAEGGTVARSVVFPAEIKLNRDRTAAVSPRYASVVRQVFAEIGDAVKKGDILASLENRETMAVYTVSAPLDGVIISKDLAVGETAGEDKVLFGVADLSSVWADINIFPRYQHLIRKGMAVRFIAHDGHTTRSKVKYVSPIVSHETRTFTARCVLSGVSEDFTPGAFVRAKINVETASVAVAVPRDAVQTIDGHSVLFVPGDHGFVTADVSLGLADDHVVEIKGGLQPGDPYVATGAFALKAHMVTSGMDPHAGHGH